MFEGLCVFVSGAAGVIGSELVPMLEAHGARVFAADLKPKPAHFSDSVEFRQGDLNNIRIEELRDRKVQIIFHLAATFERSRESSGFWSENFHNNVRLSHHIMTLAQEVPTLFRVIFASSYLVYNPSLYLFQEPKSAPVKLNEQSELRPRNLVGMAKLSHEVELEFLSGLGKGGVSYVAPRIFRGYGCGSRDVISRWVRSLVRNEKIFAYGLDSRFDYIFSRDSARGLLEIGANHDIKGPVNLGFGRARSVRDVLATLRNFFPSADVGFADGDGVLESSVADMTLFQSHLDWYPEFGLEDGIAEIVRHEGATVS